MFCVRISPSACAVAVCRAFVDRPQQPRSRGLRIYLQKTVFVLLHLTLRLPLFALVLALADPSEQLPIHLQQRLHERPAARAPEVGPRCQATNRHVAHRVQQHRVQHTQDLRADPPRLFIQLPASEAAAHRVAREIPHVVQRLGDVGHKPVPIMRSQHVSAHGGHGELQRRAPAPDAPLLCSLIRRAATGLLLDLPL